MDIKEAVINLKSWIYIAGILVLVATTAGTYAKVPGDIKELKQTDKTHDNAIKDLSVAMQQYLAVQQERDRWEEKHEERQMQLIDELRKSNGSR